MNNKTTNVRYLAQLALLAAIEVVMKLMGLGVKSGDTVTVTAEGASEDAAIAAMEQFFQANL